MAFFGSFHFRLVLAGLCFVAGLSLIAQAAQQVPADLIHLRNPSFEDIPGASNPPTGWANCGFPGESPVDVHPDPLRQFQVGGRAQQGNTFLGMVVRDNDTWEAVGQELTSPMRGGQCYDFRIFLSRSRYYVSQSRVTGQRANYITPATLRVYGGYANCDKAELIGKSEVISNNGWQEFKLKLEPSQDFTHIIFEAYYKTPVLFPYNGNVLLDNAGPLVPINCDEPLTEDPPLAEDPPADPPIAEVPPARNDPPVRRDPTPAPPPVSEPEPDVIRLGETEAILEEGSVFRIEKITFEANSDQLRDESTDALEEIKNFLHANPNAVVEIGGHASSLASTEFADEISLKRARAIVRYLTQRGIETARLFPVGYGKRYRVCTDNTSDCQRRNQRVEVKIIRLE